MAWTYLLRCADGSFYVGSTRNLEHRLDQHAMGRGSEYTSTRLPVALVWCAELDDIGEAWRMERRIHGWGRAKREALARGGFEEVQRVARGRRRSAR